MDFLILRPLPPKTGYHFFEGGVGGSKVFADQAPSSGEAQRPHTTTVGRMVTQPDAAAMVGGSSRGRCALCGGGGGGGGIFARPGFEPPTKKSTARCITVWPLLGLWAKWYPLLAGVSATDKKPKLCVSV